MKRSELSGLSIVWCIVLGAGAAFGQDAVNVDSNGNVGIGTSTPVSAFHVYRTGHVLPTFESADGNAVQFRIKSDSTNRRIVALDNSGNQESQVVFGDNGDFLFLGPTVGVVRAALNSTGLNVNGAILQNGSPIHPDYVFGPSYALESIADHAAEMWEHKHLPAVGAGEYNEAGEPIIDLGARSQGMLEELEKAHIYIEQLNERLEAKEEELAVVNDRLARLEAALPIAE